MTTPYATLKAAIQALAKAQTKLTDTLVLANDRNATMADIRTLFHYQDQASQAVIALEPVLTRIRRLSAQGKQRCTLSTNAESHKLG